MLVHNLTVFRYQEVGNSLLSNWYFDGSFICYGLENLEESIPSGFYNATRSYSPRFKKYLYELANVPGRSEILLHAANNPRELEGCLAPGLELGEGELVVKLSKLALNLIHQRSKNSSLFITVVKGY